MARHLIENTATGERQEIESYHPDALAPSEVHRGLIPAGIPTGHAIYASGQIVLDIQPLRDALWKRVKAIRIERQDATFVWAGKAIQSDAASRENIRSLAVRAAQAPLAFPIGFRTADNSTVQVSAVQMLAMQQAMAQFDQALHDHAMQLRAAIWAATTVAQIEAIDIESGWPT